MDLNDLVGKRFKYISPYSKKECDWTGVVKDYNMVQKCNKDFKTFKPEIHIISESGSVYQMNELIFFR